jgi:uncharacterized membrane protein (DUF485 family)
MSGPPAGAAQGARPSASSNTEGVQIDWEAAERSPEFQKLVHKRRAFVVPATIFFFAWYFGFIVLAGYAEGFMGESIYEGFTVGYALALSQFVMTWVLGWLYLKRADRDFDPLAKRAMEEAMRAGREGASDRTRQAGSAPVPGAATPPAAGTSEGSER